jgi:hypothetical protein
MERGQYRPADRNRPRDRNCGAVQSDQSGLNPPLRPSETAAGYLPCSSGSDRVQAFPPPRRRYIDLASWLGFLGRLGWLVIPAFCLDV